MSHILLLWEFLYLITADKVFDVLMTEWIMTQSINTTGHEWIIVLLSYATLHSIFGSFLLLCMNHTSLSHIFPFSLWLIQQFYNSVLFTAYAFDWHIMCRLFCTCTFKHCKAFCHFAGAEESHSISVIPSLKISSFKRVFILLEVRVAWFSQAFIAFKESSWIGIKVGFRQPSCQC